MTTLAWIMVILFIGVFTIAIVLWNKPYIIETGSNIMICLILVLFGLVFSSELTEKQITRDINNQYHPKTKLIILSDSTYRIDTLYYFKIKPKNK